MNARIVRLALVGLPGAGKTSYLAALHGAGWGQVRLGTADWVANAHPDSLSYLRAAWDEISNGRPVPHTSIESEHPRLRLTITRRAGRAGSATHVFNLHVLDSAGDFMREIKARTGARWEDVAGRILDADVLLLVLDAMNVFHTQLRGDAQSQQQILSFMEMAIAAVGTTGSREELLKEKLLAVCLSKCDAVTSPRIDGINDDADARLLAANLLAPEQQRRLANRFAAVRYFGISVLGEHWRWSRTGACVKVGDKALNPVGLFHPFEWIADHAKLRS